jgi:hypothetical protein
MDDESGAWLTYAEAGDRLGVSPEAVRAKAARKRWRRQIGNDGLARVWLPGDLPVTTRARTDDHPVTTRSSPDHRPGGAALVHALENHIKTLQGDKDALVQQLADERAKTEKAIAAFASLAERLDAMAAERAKPGWRRLAG